MDDVLERLNKTSLAEKCTGSGYEQLFKNRWREGSQDERRRWILESQKRKRYEQNDDRRILNLVQAVENEMETDQNQGKYKPSIRVPGFHRVVETYKDTLMLSEWLVEAPFDLQHWYVVPCPRGTRVLVVATKSRTRVYSKYGQFMFQRRTCLPGGNPLQQTRRCTVLDCVYYEPANTMYVLDVLMWSNQSMTEGQLECRHYLLQNWMVDANDFKKIHDSNQMIFSVLPKVPCTRDQLSEFMMQAPMFPDNSPPLDGLLFYNKWAQYTGGVTPLVGWLFPFMVNEVLGDDITVNQLYKAEKPTDYTTQAAYIAQFEERTKARRAGRRRRCPDTRDPGPAHADMPPIPTGIEAIRAEAREESSAADAPETPDTPLDSSTAELMDGLVSELVGPRF